MRYSREFIRMEKKKKAKNQKIIKSPTELSLRRYICATCIKGGRGPASIWELKDMFCLALLKKMEFNTPFYLPGNLSAQEEQSNYWLC